MSRLRVPPSSIESEQAVIGGLMLVPESFDRLELTEDDFYRRDHRLIFRAMAELAAMGRPFDAVTLGEWFVSHGLGEQVAGGAYLIELATTTPSAANIAAYAEIVREKHMLRQAIDVGSRLIDGCFESGGRKTAQLLDEAIRDLMGLNKVDQRCEHTFHQALSAAWDDAEEAHKHKGAIRGVPTGLKRFDKRIGGLHKQDLIFLAARPSMGKTALMVQLMGNAAKLGVSVGCVSGEQSAMQLGQRSIANESGVATEKLRSGDIEDEEWPILTEGMRRLLRHKAVIYDRSAPTLEEVCRTARRWRQERDIAVLYIDYLQRIRFPRAENRIEEVSEVARGLKTLARDLDIPVVCLAQVKAEVDKRPDKRPGLGDIANSDEATREADMIAFLYRDEVYNDVSPDRGIAELNVEKYRHGPTGQFRMKFFGETMRFADLAGEDIP